MHISRTGVILNTENYAMCVAFYRDVLGLPLLFEKDAVGERLTCLDVGGVYLMVEIGGKTVQQGKGVTDCPSKLRFNTTNIDADCEHLKRHGIAVDLRTYSWGTTAEFFDPDGNRCALRSEDDFG